MLPRPSPICCSSDLLMPSFKALGAWVLSISSPQASRAADAEIRTGMTATRKSRCLVIDPSYSFVAPCRAQCLPFGPGQLLGGAPQEHEPRGSARSVHSDDVPGSHRAEIGLGDERPAPVLHTLELACLPVHLENRHAAGLHAVGQSLRARDAGHQRENRHPDRKLWHSHHRPPFERRLAAARRERNASPVPHLSRRKNSTVPGGGSGIAPAAALGRALHPTAGSASRRPCQAI